MWEGVGVSTYVASSLFPCVHVGYFSPVHSSPHGSLNGSRISLVEAPEDATEQDEYNDSLKGMLNTCMIEGEQVVGKT